MSRYTVIIKEEAQAVQSPIFNLQLIAGTPLRSCRLIYRIFETEVHVDVLTAYGHYDDK